MHIVIACAVTAVVAGALGYGFRGAIGRELRIGAQEAEAWAKQLESGSAALVRGVAADIRTKLSKL